MEIRGDHTTPCFVLLFFFLVEQVASCEVSRVTTMVLTSAEEAVELPQRGGVQVLL